MNGYCSAYVSDCGVRTRNIPITTVDQFPHDSYVHSTIKLACRIFRWSSPRLFVDHMYVLGLHLDVGASIIVVNYTVKVVAARQEEG